MYPVDKKVNAFCEFAKNNIQLLDLNEINMRFYGAEHNNIERGEADIVVFWSIKPHIDQVQV